MGKLTRPNKSCFDKNHSISPGSCVLCNMLNNSGWINQVGITAIISMLSISLSSDFVAAIKRFFPDHLNSNSFKAEITRNPEKFLRLCICVHQSTELQRSGLGGAWSLGDCNLMGAGLRNWARADLVKLLSFSDLQSLLLHLQNTNWRPTKNIRSYYVLACFKQF